MARAQVRDLYNEAQFSSCWQVVVHASEPGADRHKLHAVATRSFTKTHRWRGYRMVFVTTKSGTRMHIGYRFANPKDWFFVPEGGYAHDAEGPFDSKNRIKSKLGLKTTRKREAGIYDAPLPEGGWVVIFTRDRAEKLFGKPDAGEELP